MITVLVAAAAMQMPAPISLTPTDDVWVYPHASDPTKDEYLRVWGGEGRSVPSDSDDPQGFSPSYLKWSLATVPAGAKLKSAELVLTHISGAGFTAEDANNNPVEARAMVGGPFTEKGWSFDMSGKILPGNKDEHLFGKASTVTIGEQAFKVTIDLLKGPGDFKAYFAQANGSTDRSLALAITSSLDPQVVGQRGIYKFFSKDAQAADSRPVLRLEIE